MKNEIKKTKNFDITTFETLDSNGNTLLKGGFSMVLDENLAYGGCAINLSKGCGCTNSCNTVAGCACPSTPTTSAPTEVILT